MMTRAESTTIVADEFAANVSIVEGELDEAAVAASEQDAKIALLGTVGPDDLPHLTLITSIQARGPRELMFGQFTEGSSKKHVKENPRTGFLIMSASREIWRGKARSRHEAKAGSDYELYNHKPMFRYNAYFGIHTVHYLDIVDLAEKRRVSMFPLLAGAAATAIVKQVGASSDSNDDRVLTPWSRTHLSKTKTLKFFAWIGEDGYPEITPPVACRAMNDRQLVFSAAGNRSELDPLNEGRSVAVYGLNLEMESVLVRGTFAGYRNYGGVRAGVVDIDWVYNSMPPKQGRIYPPQPLEPVTNFDLGDER
jgi:hypothetical protein